MKTQTFAVRGDHIQLDQLLKATGIFPSGGEAHAATTRGEVQVDGKPETRKRAKLRAGQMVECGGVRVSLTGEEAAGSQE
ncbi:hypothetical protein FACS1894185_6380 [Betaproteobacteria bacterium]|nr:hypothetical protein AGMMS49545_09100 [Betaproteobacteria bacterium]GHU12148.1 hypothetical protein FACS1894185_6380 [Betaproteobacteria bacterium]GHU44009.1 hypothetical protein AGMMS50289_11440 [Betaproteobacteria bacterium]